MFSIIVVHGLAANPKKTWLSRDGLHSINTITPSYPAMWPRDILTKEIGLKARVMAFNHNTSWRSYALDKSLHDHGDDLLQALRLARQDVVMQDSL